MHPLPDDPLADDLPPDAHSRVKAELAPGERLLWVGGPLRVSPRQVGHPRRVLAWFGGFLAFSLANVAVAWRWSSSEVTGLFAVLGGVGGFLAGVLGLALLGVLLRFRTFRRAHANTTYALTDRRALVWRPQAATGGIEVFTYPAHSLISLHRVEYPDGTGDIVFSGARMPAWDSRGFDSVADVRNVEALAREVLVDPRPAGDQRIAFSTTYLPSPQSHLG